jgi:peptide/nickel transport system substrate-binding protein
MINAAHSRGMGRGRPKLKPASLLPARSSFRVLILFVAICTILAGCGVTTTPQEPSAPRPRGTTDTRESDPTRTLRWGRESDVSRFDPHRASVSQDNEVLFLVYDRLVHQDVAGRQVPGLATKWSFDPDGLALTMTLRDGVTFHDGQRFDASVVKANIERAKTVQGSAVASELAPITTVEVVDPLTARLVLSAPAANVPAILSDRAGAMVSPAALDSPDLDSNPVGTGMYRMHQYLRGARISLVRNDAHWDPEAVRMAGVDITVLADPQARFNALQTGQIDMAILNPDQAEQATAAGLVIDDSVTLETWYAVMNKTRPGLDNRNVRLALNHAIDRHAIVDTLLYGYGQPAAQMLPEGADGHSNAVGRDFYSYDPEKARRLLAESGLPLPVPLEMLRLGGRAQYEQMTEVMQAQLEAVGFDVNIRTISPTEAADVMFVREEGDLLPGAWGGRPSSLATLTSIFGGQGFANPGGYTDPQIEDLLARAAASIDDAARADLMAQASLLAAEEALTVPLYHARTPLVMSGEVVGLQKYRSGKIEFRGVGMTAVG